MTRRAFDAVHWYMAEQGSRVVAKTGIPSDRHHIGKLILHSLQDDPDFVMQIDGGTGKSETYGSAMDRSIRCAISLTNLGLKKGDVMVLMGPNHIDFCIPHYAALYLGIMIASIDATLGPNELKDLFHTNRPNIIFCQSEKTTDIQKALEMSKEDAIIVTFDNDIKHTTLAHLLGNEDEKTIKIFKPTDFEPVDTVAYLTSTSGTTGVTKTAMLTHKNLSIGTPYIWASFSKFPTPTRLVIMPSPAQWLSAGFHYLFSPILKVTRLQTSSSLTPEHFAELVNKYKISRPTDFEPVDTVAYLTSTSGTTGVTKTAMLTHKNLSIGTPYIWASFSKFPTPTRLVIMPSPAQWLSAGFHYLFSPILKVTRLQTSSSLTPEHFAELVNKYKPTHIVISPTMMTTMMTSAKCDFTCFESVFLGGSAVTPEVVDEVKQIAKIDIVYALYGMSELSGLAIQHDCPPAPGSCGRPIGCMELKLMDPETNKDITEPNVYGELWCRGPTVFKGYYNNPEVTKETLTEGGWLKSGDIFYRDHSWNMFFVERYKLLLKYRNHQVSPVEIETLIMRHPGVFHVAVTGIPDRECGDLVVACVVPKPGCSPTAQEIKDLVKESLTDSKQLRGGVIFMKELPTTSTSKINRKKLKELVLTMPRE